MDFYLFDAVNHPQAWLDFAKQTLEKPAPGKIATSMLIQHPLLTWTPLDIKAVVVLDVMQPEQDDTGGWTITVKFQSYAPPKSVKVSAAKTPDVPNAPPTPKTAAEMHTAALSAQRDALANGNDKSGLF